MFTGLIEEIGRIKKISRKNGLKEIEIQAAKVMSDIKPGSSIAVNGACLTMIGFGKDSFRVEVMKETLDLTNIGGLKTGDFVNLERPLKMSDRLEGHIVTGHIDSKGLIRSTQRSKEAVKMKIKCPPEITRYIIRKGSIAVDGVSLTVISVKDNVFSVGLIPHTLKHSTLGRKKNGEEVNLEADMIGKYIERFAGPREDISKVKIESFLGGEFR